MLCVYCRFHRAALRLQPCGCAVHPSCISFPCGACTKCGAEVGGVTFAEPALRNNFTDEDVQRYARSGRWTEEEEQYANGIRDAFKAHRLPIARKTKLANLLMSLLRSNNVRVSRKIPQDKGLEYAGRLRPDEEDGSADTAAGVGGCSNNNEGTTAMAQQSRRLLELEDMFVLSVSVLMAVPAALIRHVLDQTWYEQFVAYAAEVGQPLVRSTAPAKLAVDMDLRPLPPPLAPALPLPLPPPAALSPQGKLKNTKSRGKRSREEPQPEDGDNNTPEVKMMMPARRVSLTPDIEAQPSVVVDAAGAAAADVLAKGFGASAGVCASGISSSSSSGGDLRELKPVRRGSGSSSDASRSSSDVRDPKPARRGSGSSSGGSNSNSSSGSSIDGRGDGRAASGASLVGPAAAAAAASASGDRDDAGAANAGGDIYAPGSLSTSEIAGDTTAEEAEKAGDLLGSVEAPQRLLPPAAHLMSAEAVVSVARRVAKEVAAAAGALNGSQLTDDELRGVYDDALFDQMCALCYNYRALSLLRPEFQDHAVLPLLGQVMSAFTSRSVLWLFDAQRSCEVLAVTPNVLEAFDFTAATIGKRPMADAPCMQGMFHIQDTLQFIKYRAERLGEFHAMVERAQAQGVAITPFEDNAQRFLRQHFRVRFRLHPELRGGYSTHHDTWTFDGCMLARYFVADSFILVIDRVTVPARAMRSNSRMPPQPPLSASAFGAAAAACAGAAATANAAAVVASASLPSGMPQPFCLGPVGQPVPLPPFYDPESDPLSTITLAAAAEYWVGPKFKMEDDDVASAPCSRRGSANHGILAGGGGGINIRAGVGGSAASLEMGWPAASAAAQGAADLAAIGAAMVSWDECPAPAGAAVVEQVPGSPPPPLLWRTQAHQPPQALQCDAPPGQLLLPHMPHVLEPPQRQLAPLAPFLLQNTHAGGDWGSLSSHVLPIPEREPAPHLSGLVRNGGGVIATTPRELLPLHQPPAMPVAPAIPPLGQAPFAWSYGAGQPVPLVPSHYASLGAYHCGGEFQQMAVSTGVCGGASQLSHVAADEVGLWSSIVDLLQDEQPPVHNSGGEGFASSSSSSNVVIEERLPGEVQQQQQQQQRQRQHDGIIAPVPMHAW